jgi:hypothetical protein
VSNSSVDKPTGIEPGQSWNGHWALHDSLLSRHSQYNDEPGVLDMKTSSMYVNIDNTQMLQDCKSCICDAAHRLHQSVLYLPNVIRFTSTRAK